MDRIAQHGPHGTRSISEQVPDLARPGWYTVGRIIDLANRDPSGPFPVVIKPGQGLLIVHGYYPVLRPSDALYCQRLDARPGLAPVFPPGEPCCDDCDSGNRGLLDPVTHDCTGIAVEHDATCPWLPVMARKGASRD